LKSKIRRKNEREQPRLVAELKKQKKDAAELIEKTRLISDRIRTLDDQVVEVEGTIKKALDRIPNMPHSSVPPGKDPAANVEIKSWGVIPKFDFKVKDHLALGEDLDILDFKRGSKISGSPS
jgi:seryl-tRNA synthetase